MATIIEIQDKLIATLKKCLELPPDAARKNLHPDTLYIRHGRGGAYRAAMNKAQRELEAMGFDHIEANRIIRDARAMVVLELECEA